MGTEQIGLTSRIVHGAGDDLVDRHGGWLLQYQLAHGNLKGLAWKGTAKERRAFEGIGRGRNRILVETTILSGSELGTNSPVLFPLGFQGDWLSVKDL